MVDCQPHPSTARIVEYKSFCVRPLGIVLPQKSATCTKQSDLFLFIAAALMIATAIFEFNRLLVRSIEKEKVS